MLRSSEVEGLKSSGNTQLHDLIIKSTPINELKEFIQLHDPHQIAKMARTINDIGHTPVDLLYKTKLNYSEHERDEISDLLLSFMLKQDVKPLSEKINADEVGLGLSASSKLYQNLLLASWLVNETRSVIDNSYTHPDINRKGEEEKRQIGANLENVRAGWRAAIAAINVETNFADHMLNSYATPVKNFRTGNCGEFSFYTLYLLRQLRCNINGAIIAVNKGNHFFVVLGAASKANWNDTATWGKEAVVCDAWSGNVYPASELLLNLGTCRLYKAHETNYKILTSFNERYHSLDSELTIADLSTESPVLPADKKMQESFLLFSKTKMTQPQNDNQETVLPPKSKLKSSS